MPWRPLTIADLTQRLTISEQAMLVNASGQKPVLPYLLADGIGVFNGALLAIGNQVGPAGTVPDQLRNDIIGYILGLLFRTVPTLKAFYSDARKDAYREAGDKLLKIHIRLK